MEEHDLDELKREIVESRSLVIKTNNLVNALGADLKSIARRQQSYERRILVNSATAYVVTVLVIFVVLKIAWDARVDALRAESKGVREKVADLEQGLERARTDEELRLRTARRAAEFWDLVAQGKRREVIEQYPEVSKLPLTRTEKAVFDQAVERARNEQSLLAYQEGLDHARTGRWHEAQLSFREALSLKSDAAHSAQATLELGRALKFLGRQREAIPLLLRESEASMDRDVMDDATLLLAECQIEIQAWNDAKATLRSFLRRFPNSEKVNEVRLRLQEISARH